MLGISLLAIGLFACGGGDAEQSGEENGEEAGNDEEVAIDDETIDIDDEAIDAAIDAENIPNVIATVNGEDINKDIYVDTLQQQMEMLPMQGISLDSEEAEDFIPMLKEQLLEQIINEEVLKQAAIEEGLAV